MGEMISGISVLLGSAVVSTIITTVFNQYNNRKSNSLEYITKERKVWRDKIRSIAEKIYECEFEGRGEKDIEKYLVELELNINSYGRGNVGSAREDAYIWNEIDEIRTVDSLEYFNKHKELLIYYISLMLKEDWDRSKNEVAGFSQMFIDIMKILLINLGFACFYLYLGKCTLDTSIVVLAEVIIFTIFIYIIYKGIQFVADIVFIPLNGQWYHHFVFKLIVVLSIVIGIAGIVALCLFLRLHEEFKDNEPLNFVVLIACFLEQIKIFWNWFDCNLRKLTLSLQIVYNRENILKERYLNIKKYGEDMEEIYQYINENQDDINLVKSSVFSLKRLFNKYEREVKKCLGKEAKEVLTIDVRNRISELEKNLEVIKQRRKNINQYYNRGLINKTRDLSVFIKKLCNKINEVIIFVKNFFYKERGKLE